ncbi:hypothetical protein [Candidatus Palauibacter sp.]|uniref:hypothetical protein n=1 Tax=Candidatus Palauibacter sp. TaxID=3101350 RepID=UPI003B0249A4
MSRLGECWTEAEDAVIRSRLAEGSGRRVARGTWETVARLLGRPRDSVTARAYYLREPTGRDWHDDAWTAEETS